MAFPKRRKERRLKDYTTAGWSKADGFSPLPRAQVRTREEALEQARQFLKEAKGKPSQHMRAKLNQAIDELVRRYKLSWKELYGR